MKARLLPDKRIQLSTGENLASGDARYVPIVTFMVEWQESKHHRGQPGNAGQFGSGGSNPSTNGNGKSHASPETQLTVQADKIASDVTERTKGIWAKVGAAGKFFKDKTKAVYGLLEKRYGRNQAIAIFAAGHIAGLASPLVVLPGSTLIGMVPFAAMAEVYLQAKRGLSAMRHDEQPQLSDANIRKLGADLFKMLTEQWQEVQTRKFVDDSVGVFTVKPGWVGNLPEAPSKPLYKPNDPNDHIPFAEAPREVALPGHDGQQAEKLLKASEQKGIETLNRLAESAVKRMLDTIGEKSITHQVHLFTQEELKELAYQLAATMTTADLLGRARIRIRAAKEIEEDKPTDFSVFAEPEADDIYLADLAKKVKDGISQNVIIKQLNKEGKIHLEKRLLAMLTPEQLAIPGIKPLSPLKAIEYFRKLVPSLGADHGRYGAFLERKAFTLAHATELEVLKRVQGVIAERLTTGEKIRKAKNEIGELLDQAGISPRNPQYPEAVFRTNMMESYRAGSQREYLDPDMKEFSSCWQFLGIKDGRERHGPSPLPDHRRWFGKYFPRHVLFDEVRGTDAANVINCRCIASPVFIGKWKRLQAQGARLETWPQ